MSTDTGRASGYLTAREAAAALGVTPATLYAYVSRGLVRSEASAGRERRYHASDIAALRRRRQARDPNAAAEGALNFGAPVLDSAITLILDGHLYYRGQDAAVLARTASIREVAALLWQGDPAVIFAAENLPETGAAFATLRRAAAGLAPIERCLSLLPAAAAADPRAADIAPEAVASTGARILRLLAAIAADTEPSARPIDAVLAEAWGAGAGTRALIRAALILCADHELNVSAFTARCIASARASPYNAVLGGIAALQGAWHGGETERADAFLGDAFAAADVAAFCAEKLRLGERLPGFGHPLYPQGDPRARVLLHLLQEGGRPLIAEGLHVAKIVGELIGRPANIDFALALLRRSLELPAGTGLAFFAIGRSMGWIAQALEQYATGRIIRPRARYVGPSVR